MRPDLDRQALARLRARNITLSGGHMKEDFSKEMAEEWGDIGPVLAALGSITRQRILMLFEPDEQLNIKCIADQFNLSRTAVVHHISVLQEAGILKSERVGKEVIMNVDWDLVYKTVDKVKDYIAASGHLTNRPKFVE